MKCTWVIGVLFTVVVGQAAPTLSDAERAWMQATLSNWEKICRDHLRIPVEPLPWTIYYDQERAWHVNPERDRLPAGSAAETGLRLRFAGKDWDVFTVPHAEGKLWTPAQTALLKLEPRAAAFAYDDNTKPFFVLALPRYWRTLPGADTFPGLEKFFLGVASHEICHTRQIVDIARRIDALRAKGELPAALDDDIVQQTFGADPEYAAAFRRECDAMRRAVFTRDDAERRRLARAALALARERRGKYFTGPRAIFSEVEDLFVVMEGVAEGCQYRLALDESLAGTSAEQVYRDLLGREAPWVQEHGLLVLLLIDHFVEEWPSRFLTADFPSPFAVLEEALRE